MTQVCATESVHLEGCDSWPSGIGYGDSGARTWRVASAFWAEPLMIGKPKPVVDVIARASLTPRVSTLHALIAWHFAAFAYPELRITSTTPQSP